MLQIDVQTLSLTLGKRQLLDNISLSLATGEVLAIIGENGCGKSSLMKVLFGTRKADKLNWTLNGEKLGAPSPKNELIAMLPQDSFLPRSLAPSELIAMMYKTHEHQKPLYRIPYISDYALKKMQDLSHGAARYVEIVMILHLWHPFILLDEPFSLLAPMHREVIKNLIRAKSREKGIIITDHYREDLMEIGTRSQVLHLGNLS